MPGLLGRGIWRKRSARFAGRLASPIQKRRVRSCAASSRALRCFIVDRSRLWNALPADSIDVLHIVGGGSRNALLNQCAANATGRAVLAGPVEATAIGNVLLQAIALGDLDSLTSVRRVVRQSFPEETFTPEENEAVALGLRTLLHLVLRDWTIFLRAAPMQKRSFSPRMKICPSLIASEE